MCNTKRMIGISCVILIALVVFLPLNSLPQYSSYGSIYDAFPYYNPYWNYGYVPHLSNWFNPMVLWVTQYPWLNLTHNWWSLLSTDPQLSIITSVSSKLSGIWQSHLLTGGGNGIEGPLFINQSTRSIDMLDSPLLLGQGILENFLPTMGIISFKGWFQSGNTITFLGYATWEGGYFARIYSFMAVPYNCYSISGEYSITDSLGGLVDRGSFNLSGNRIFGTSSR